MVDETDIAIPYERPEGSAPLPAGVRPGPRGERGRARVARPLGVFYARKAPVLEALEALGVSLDSIAVCFGTKVSTVANWAGGGEGLDRKRYVKLRGIYDLVKEYLEAERERGDGGLAETITARIRYGDKLIEADRRINPLYLDPKNTVDLTIEITKTALRNDPAFRVTNIKE